MSKDSRFNLPQEVLTHAITITRIVLEEVNDQKVQRAYLGKLETRLSLFSESEELLFYGVKLLFKLKEYDMAIEYLIRFLKKDAHSRLAWTFLARALLDLDEVLATACVCRAILQAENSVLLVDTNVELILCIESLKNFKAYHWLLPISFYQEGAHLADEALELC